MKTNLRWLFLTVILIVLPLSACGAQEAPVEELVIAGDIPGQEIEYPMAIVILGGLATSTLLNLLVVPTFYLRFGKEKSFSSVQQA